MDYNLIYTPDELREYIKGAGDAPSDFGNTLDLIEKLAGGPAEDTKRLRDIRAFMVDNQAIVIPETIDAIRAMTGLAADAAASMALTDTALGIGHLAKL